MNKKFSFKQKFVSGEFLFAFWDSVSTGIGLVNTFLIVTALTVYQYGVFQLLLSVYAIFDNILGLGSSVIGNDIVRFIGEGKESEAKRLFFEFQIPRFFLGIIFASLIFFGSPLLSHWYAPDALANIKPLAVLLVLEILFTAGKALLAYRLQYKLTASRATLYKVAQLSLLFFFFIKHTLGVQEVIYSMIFGSIISIIVLARPIVRSYKIWGSIKASPRPIIFWIFRNHGKWDIFQQFLSNLTANLQPWVIKVFVSTEAVAIYSVAQTIVSTFLGFLPTKTLGTLVSLRASNLDRLQRVYSYASKYLFLFAIGLAVLAASITPPVIYFIFPKYVPALPYFFALLIWMPISALSAVVSLFLVVLRQQKYLFYQKVFKVISVVPMLGLVFLFGIWGLVTYQIVFSFILFSTAFMLFRNVPPGFKLGWRRFLHFNDDDRQFLETFWRPALATLKRKIPFLSLFS